MRFFFLFTFFTLIFKSIIAGQVSDSLIKLIDESEGKQKLHILCDLCWEFRTISPDSALMFGNMALNLSKEIGDEEGKAQAFNDLGIIYLDKGSFDTAYNYFINSLQIRTLNADSSGMGSSYNKIGILFQKQGKLDKALENQMKALEIFEKLKKDLWVAYTLNNIAIINFNIGNLETSLEYHEKGLAMRLKLEDEYGIANSYGNIANVQLALSDTNSAINNYVDALKIFSDLDNKEAESVQLANLGTIYLARKNYQAAIFYINRSLELREVLGDKKAIASSCLKLGEVYLELNNFDDAYIYFMRARNLASEIDVVDEKVQSFFDLTKLFLQKKNKDSSYKYLTLYSFYKDSLYNTRLNQQIVDAQIKYDVDQKNKDIQLYKSKTELNESKLKQRRLEIWLLTSVIILLIAMAVFIFINRKRKQVIALNNARILHNQNMMQAVIDAQEEERQRIARELHDGVGQTLSAIKLNWENTVIERGLKGTFPELVKSLDEAVDEVRSISHQMIPKELEQFGLIPAVDAFLEGRLSSGEINYEFEHHNIVNRLDSSIELAIFRIVQELTGNVVRHSKAKNMSVQIIVNIQNVVLMVTDDGIGFDTKENLKHGIGLMNIESRVNGLNGIVNFESSPETGTSVTIRIPVNKNQN